MRIRYPVYLILLVVVFAGCATRLQPPALSPAMIEAERLKQRELALRMYLERADQVARVNSLLRKKGAEFCGEQVEPGLGLLWADRKSLPEDFWDVGERVFGLGDELRVLSVVPGLAANAAGIKAGDIVVKINGAEIAPGFSVKIFEKTSRTDKAREMIREAGMKPLDLEIKRAGQTLQVTLEPQPACSFSTIIVVNDRVNAFADGKNVGITTGMLRFAKDDDELAIVVGHELAHNILGHVSHSKAAVLAGGLLGTLLDAAAAVGGVNTGGLFGQWAARAALSMFSQDFEKEADYLGLYFAARAGFDISKASDFWRRMAVEYPANIKENFLATHPSSPERAISIDAAIREINEKARLALPLTPAKVSSTLQAYRKPSAQDSDRE